MLCDIAFSINEINLNHLRKDKIEIRENQTVKTSDDDGYLEPFRVFSKTGSIYRNEFEKYDSLVRLPGYGSMYGIFASIFGLDKALFYLKLFQLLLFGLSVYCLFFVATIVLKNQLAAFIVTGIYGLLPFSMGFLYYTLTEGITPALIIFYVFFLLKAGNSQAVNKKHLYYFIVALLFAYLFLTRPLLGIFGLALPCFLYSDFYDRKKAVLFLKYIFFYGSVSLSLMFAWQARNYFLTGKISGLNPIYQNEIPGTFRKTHKAIWDFFKGWESNGANFHGIIVPLWKSSIEGDTTKKNVDIVISKMPLEVVNYFGKQRLSSAFKNYQLSTLFQKKYLENHILMPSELPAIEQNIVDTFNCMENEYKSHFRFTYHIITPLKVYKNLTFHSNLSLYIFQKTYRGSFFMEALRWLCFIIHSSAFLLCLFFIFFSKNLKLVSLFGLPILIYIFYLIYFQRGIEERYTLPILPLVIIGAAFVVSEIISRNIYINKKTNSADY